jgi:AcrR family transcriptional regulator
LLAREGYEGFSMRKLAVLCNVSHAAPYKHFKGKEEIIQEISLLIAREFGSALTQAVSLHPAAPRLQLIEMCVSYVQFLLENPDYFRFVFMTAHSRPIEVSLKGILPGERNPIAAALICAEAYFRPLHGDGWVKDFLSIWSMLQGLTLIQISETIQYDEEYAVLVRTLVENYIDAMERAV